MNERKVYTREFKLHAASMVLDDRVVATVRGI